ncbi:MAG TPA: DUF3034 family protein [Aliidongia sp.]|uniref:DUF3034 family protein n=1 Tax=Aliidongia sp. TaxID=1914230 RepID=UPI002DDDA84C|nr:DUF3034 family protein [Aliidongia sp.]HEV2673151.1 DUF3034 family protein [Aliidongia sp.]
MLVIPAMAATQDAADPSADEPERVRPLFDEGKLLATGGVSQVEGAGGGGLATWAVIGGYGTADGIGITAHETFVGLRSFNLNSAGVAVGLYDRVELSYAHQSFDTRATGAALGLGKGFTFDENVVGAKLRLFGQLVYDQSWLPQTAIGLQYKSNDRGDILKAVGAKDTDGVDFYAAATKLLLSESVLVSGTLRMTKANQFGILGFGSAKDDSYQPEFEGSAAYLISKRFAIGADYRTKPNNLGFAEQNAYDLFAAYFLDKHASLTLAYVDLGSIATRKDQDGVYASLQLGF